MLARGATPGSPGGPWPGSCVTGRGPAKNRPWSRRGAGSLVGVEDDEYLAEFPEQYLAELPEQMRVRLAKRGRLLAEGADPYPVSFPRTNTIAEVRDKYPDLAADTATGEHVGVTGRVMLSRIAGKLCFATIRDGTGDIQVMISADRVGEDELAAWKRDVDLGDHIGVEGEVISSGAANCRCWPTGSRSRPRPFGRFPTNTMG